MSDGVGLPVDARVNITVVTTNNPPTSSDSAVFFQEDSQGTINFEVSDDDNDVYVTCIGTGETQAEDTKNGYFLNMDKSVDVFATKISKDPMLQQGFHAVGFSQGNNIIRGYIA